MGAFGNASVGIGVVGLIILIIAIPLIVYHFLIYPNVEGFFGDLDFYNPDGDSNHFLYWFWFWNIAFSSGLVVVSRVKA